ncbi:hypothetical protein ACFQ0M_45310 [Kitasatospora aburaviensis]
MTGRKLRFGMAALGLLALPLAAAAPAAAAPTYRVDCPSSKYYWCDQVSSDGVIADLMIHNGPDTGATTWPTSTSSPRTAARRSGS